MKKARIILTSLLAVAIVSGAMAFRAHRSSVVYTNDPIANVCTVTTLGTIDPAGQPTFASAQSLTDQPCPSASVIFE